MHITLHVTSQFANMQYLIIHIFYTNKLKVYKSLKHYLVCHTCMFIISWIFHNILSLSPILFHQEVHIDQIIRYLINLDIGLIATD